MSEAAVLDEALERLLVPHLGYTLRPWPARLYSMLREFAVQSQTDDVSIVRTLQSSPHDPRLASVLDAATVPHTQFFRHPEQLDALTVWLRGREDPVDIWCAGCATGEEAWSLSICAERAGRQARILATDVSAGAIAKARTGVYPPRRTVVDVPGFRAGERWTASDSLRKTIRFEVASLVSDRPALGAGPFDVVFCRNVLIYFSHRNATALLAKLAHQVVPDGVLVIAPVDVLVPLPPSLEPTVPLGWLKHRPRATAPRPIPAPAAVAVPPRTRFAKPTPSTDRRDRLGSVSSSAGDERASEPPELERAARLLGSGERRAAEEALRVLLDQSPNDARAWFLLGEALASRGEKTQARLAFERAARTAVSHPPRDIDATTLAAAARRRAKDR